MTGDHTPLWQYALGCVGFTAAFLAVPLFLSWLNRRVDQRINLHVHKALHGNVRVLPNRNEQAS